MSLGRKLTTLYFMDSMLLAGNYTCMSTWKTYRFYLAEFPYLDQPSPTTWYAINTLLKVDE